jgi:Cof subfamily protein (haloacid dehalogenase superfamily)
MSLSQGNKTALERAIAAGIEVVVATGRSLTSIPDEVKDIAGIDYLICANGAKIYDNRTQELLYSKYLTPEAIESVWDIITGGEIMCEVFWNGRPYVEKAAYEGLSAYGIPDTSREYITRSRTPVVGLPEFTREHITEIENINFNCGIPAKRLEVEHRLRRFDLYSLTSSFSYNLEIGGIGVSKAAALAWLCEKQGIKPSEVMAIGDNDNDVSMIKFAGVGVAMEEAVKAAWSAANFITRSNDDDGVAFVIDLLLDE